MKFTKSNDGVQRADVRVAFRFTAEQIEHLKRRAKALGCKGFHSAIVEAFHNGMGEWDEVEES